MTIDQCTLYGIQDSITDWSTKFLPEGWKSERAESINISKYVRYSVPTVHLGFAKGIYIYKCLYGHIQAPELTFLLPELAQPTSLSLLNSAQQGYLIGAPSQSIRFGIHCTVYTSALYQDFVTIHSTGGGPRPECSEETEPGLQCIQHWSHTNGDSAREPNILRD